MKRPSLRYGALIGVPLGIAAIAGGIAYAKWVSTVTQDGGSTVAAAMPTGAKPTASAAGSTVALAWKAQTLVGGTAPVEGYRIVRYDATGAETPATGECAGTVKAAVCTETGVPDGKWRYAVRPTWAAAWTGPVGDKSNEVTVSTVGITFPRDGASYGGTALAHHCAKGADLFCGTAAAGAGRAIRVIRVSLQQGAGNYWKWSEGAFAAPPTASGAPPEALKSLGTGTSWTVPFGAGDFPAAGQYTLRAEVTDSEGRKSNAAATFTVYPPKPAPPTISASGLTSPTNQTSATFAVTSSAPGATFRCSLDGGAFVPCPGAVSGPASGTYTATTAVSNLADGAHTLRASVTDRGGKTSDPSPAYPWTVDTVAPTASDVQATPSASTTGEAISAGDQLSLSFSEAILPGSILSGWNGKGSQPVKLRITRGSEPDHPDQAAFVDGTGQTIGSLGTVALGHAGHVSEDVDIPAMLALSPDGRIVTLTIEPAGDDVATRLVAVVGTSQLSWTPSGGCRDPAGNALARAGVPVLESGKLDIDF